MPTKHGRVTEKNFKAPKGKYRIIKEHVRDRRHIIIADIYKLSSAKQITNWLRNDDVNNIYTLWDDQGKEINTYDH